MSSLLGATMIGLKLISVALADCRTYRVYDFFVEKVIKAREHPAASVRLNDYFSENGKEWNYVGSKIRRGGIYTGIENG
jgi:hypothetical protein